MRTIAIVGGGFSGTVLAAQLLRQPPAAATRIALVERRGEITERLARHLARRPAHGVIH